jgi:hypothetical protein
MSKGEHRRAGAAILRGDLSRPRARILRQLPAHPGARRARRALRRHDQPPRLHDEPRRRGAMARLAPPRDRRGSADRLTVPTRMLHSTVSTACFTRHRATPAPKRYCATAPRPRANAGCLCRSRRKASSSFTRSCGGTAGRRSNGCARSACSDFYINGELDIVVKFAVDSLLEQTGFELSVPHAKLRSNSS